MCWKALFDTFSMYFVSIHSIVDCRTWFTCLCWSRVPVESGGPLWTRGAMAAPDPPSSGLTWTFVFWLTQLTLVTTDMEIRNQNTAGKPRAEIQNTFYISFFVDYLSDRSSLLSSHTWCLFLLCPSFLSLPPKNNWEMNDNTMSDDDIMDNFQYNNCYFVIFHGTRNTCLADWWWWGGCSGDDLSQYGTLCPRSGSCGTLIQNTWMRRMSEIQQPPL